MLFFPLFLSSWLCWFRGMNCMKHYRKNLQGIILGHLFTSAFEEAKGFCSWWPYPAHPGNSAQFCNSELQHSVPNEI